MNIESIFKKKGILVIFLSLVIIVFSLQFYLLDLALKIGFKPDDWALYFKYKTLGLHPLSKVLEVWGERGIYTTYQVYYMGLLESIVGFDYRSFQIVNVIFKASATLAVFPLVLVIFKNKSLAVLTTLLFAISHSSVGPLEFVVKGSDYLAIFWMCIFLTVYCLIIKKYPRNFLLLSVSLILLLLSLLFSPIRIFPILILLPLIEIYLLMKNLNLENFKNILMRISILYLPMLALMLYAPDSLLGILAVPLGIFNKIIEGNWHFLLYPFSGMGYTFIPGEYWHKIFGLLSLNTFQEYITFLSGGPTVIFGILTLIVAFLNSKRPWFYFLFTFCLNFILEILVFFVATNSRFLPHGVGLSYDQMDLYPALFGVYVSVVGFTSFIEWVKRNKIDNRLFEFWSGTLFLFLFTFATWTFAPFGTSFSGTSYYLVVSSMGSSLLMAAFLLSLYYKSRQTKSLVLKIVLLALIFILMISINVLDANKIRSRFLDLLSNGRSAHGQQVIQGRFKEYTKSIDFSIPALFYFDTSDIPRERPFYSEGFLASFPFWMHLRSNQLTDGCLEMLYLNEYKQLLPYIKEQDGQKGFFYRGLCVNNGKAGYKDIFYKPENFYAFKIKDRDFIDIKKELLKELGF